MAAMTFPVLHDGDLCNMEAARVAVAAAREAVLAHGRGALVAPPRYEVTFEAGTLVFTVGGTSEAVGFRAYDTFPDSRQDQVVAVWNTATGKLQGLAVGSMLGALRTGAVGAVAVDALANEGARRCGVIGSGTQARTQLLCATTVRDFDEVLVFSPTTSNRERFAREMTELTGKSVIPVADAESAVRHADVLLCASSSPTPVFDASWLTTGSHVNTVGPKFMGHHELPVAAAKQADIVATDSPQQIAAQGDLHFLAHDGGGVDIADLADVLSGAQRRTASPTRTVFLSAGLAGTEPLIAQALLCDASATSSPRN